MKKMIYGLILIGTIGILTMCNGKDVGEATEKPIYTVQEPYLTLEELMEYERTNYKEE